MAVLLVLAAVTGATSAATGGSAGGVGTVQGPVDNDTSGETSEVMEVQVLSNGSAEWTIVTTVPLRGANGTAAFERVAEAFERGGIGRSVETFRRAAAAASAATGREMNVTNVSRSATLLEIDRIADTAPPGVSGGVDGFATPDDIVGTDEPGVTATERPNATRAVGRFVLSFRWTGFANRTDGLLRVGDAFDTTEGTWLPGLGEDQTLVIRKPPGYSYLRAPIGPERGVLRWSGPVEFAPGSPSAVYVRRGSRRGRLPDPVPPSGLPPADGQPPANTTTPPDESPSNRSSPGGSPFGEAASPRGTDEPFPPEIADSPPVVVGFGVAALVALAALAYLLRQRGGAEERPGPAAGTDPGGRAERSPAGGTDGAGAAEGAQSSDGAPPNDRDRATSEGSAADGALLTDEERVEALLGDNEGRMRQARIVAETDWSNAKVSQLLSGMAEEGRVEKLRLGRENLISLPGHGVEDTNGGAGVGENGDTGSGVDEGGPDGEPGE